MQSLVDDFITMNQAGQVIELCHKYYDENVLMLNNGVVFAKTRQESIDKQQGYLSAVKEFDVKLVEKNIIENIAELTFAYKITGADGNPHQFIGKHIQTWHKGKIIKEEYLSLEQVAV
jgi:hypothetical protein